MNRTRKCIVLLGFSFIAVLTFSLFVYASPKQTLRRHGLPPDFPCPQFIEKSISPKVNVANCAKLDLYNATLYFSASFGTFTREEMRAHENSLGRGIVRLKNEQFEIMSFPNIGCENRNIPALINGGRRLDIEMLREMSTATVNDLPRLCVGTQSAKTIAKLEIIRGLFPSCKEVTIFNNNLFFGYYFSGAYGFNIATISIFNKMPPHSELTLTVSMLNMEEEKISRKRELVENIISGISFKCKELGRTAPTGGRIQLSTQQFLGGCIAE